MSDLVQPILVTLDDSHERIVTTAARASLLACKAPTEEPWATWLSGRFTKSVRRVKEKDLAKVEALALPHASLTGGNMRAVAFQPLAYDDFPRPLRSAQVQGTDAPREAENADAALVDFMLDHHSPLYLVNDSLHMSTGKTAAQVAHAYWMAWLSQSERSPSEFPHPATMWVDASVFDKYKSRAKHVVTDSGLTELSGPTDTVIVL